MASSSGYSPNTLTRFGSIWAIAKRPVAWPGGMDRPGDPCGRRRERPCPSADGGGRGPGRRNRRGLGGGGKGLMVSHGSSPSIGQHRLTHDCISLCIHDLENLPARAYGLLSAALTRSASAIAIGESPLVWYNIGGRGCADGPFSAAGAAGLRGRQKARGRWLWRCEKLLSAAIGAAR